MPEPVVVYTANHFIEASLLAAALKSAGIDVHVLGEHLLTSHGHEGQRHEFGPQLLVASEDLEAAVQVLLDLGVGLDRQFLPPSKDAES